MHRLAPNSGTSTGGLIRRESSVTTAPFDLTGIDHIVLRVVDLGRVLRFYSDVLGCAIEREQPEIGLTQLRAGRSLIDLITVDGKLGAAGGAPPGEEARTRGAVFSCWRIARTC